MATEFDRQISPLEMERLQTSIKYHDWFLGFVVVVGVTLSIYLVDSINTLQDGLADVRTRIEVMQRDIDVMQEKFDVMQGKIDVMQGKIDVMQGKIDVMQGDIDTLDRKMDRYHGSSGL